MTFQRIWARLSLIAWLFPLAAMAAGALFSPLRSYVGEGFPSIDITPGLLAQVLVLAGWLLAEYRFAASRETPIGQLQSDAFRSLFLSLILSFGAGWLLALGKCPWFYVVPAATTIVDAFLTANQGLNNAAQKPLVAHDIARRG
jgi:hypothetical protein